MPLHVMPAALKTRKCTNRQTPKNSLNSVSYSLAKASP